MPTPPAVTATPTVLKDLRLLVATADKLARQADPLGIRKAMVRARAYRGHTPDTREGQLWADIFVTTPFNIVGMRRIRIEGLYNEGTGTAAPRPRHKRNTSSSINPSTSSFRAVDPNGGYRLISPSTGMFRAVTSTRRTQATAAPLGATREKTEPALVPVDVDTIDPRFLSGVWDAQSMIKAIDTVLFSYSRSDGHDFPTNADGEDILRVSLKDFTVGEWSQGALPASSGYHFLDDVAVEDLRQLYENSRQLAADPATGRLGYTESLLAQPVLTVSDSTVSMSSNRSRVAEIPLRTVVGLAKLGFLGGDVARVSVTSMWTRIDTRIGTVFTPRDKLNLLAF